ncbi:MAG: macro domain-containing protein [Oscillospiraceae bacterium]|nr:macro domain-containing protein [Oscillospiraceae bacterium]
MILSPPFLPGQAAITPAYNLQAEYLIHTVGPV